MPDKQPGAREHPLQLLAVDLVVDKDLAADLPRRQIDETRPIPLFTRRHDDLQTEFATPAKAGAHSRHGSRPFAGKTRRAR